MAQILLTVDTRQLTVWCKSCDIRCERTGEAFQRMNLPFHQRQQFGHFVTRVVSIGVGHFSNTVNLAPCPRVIAATPRSASRSSVRVAAEVFEVGP